MAVGHAGGVVVVGAGHAGVQVADSLRAAGFDGSVTVLGEEARTPYQRPPLSKEMSSARAMHLPLRPDGFYADQRIELRPGARVTRIDRAGRAVLLDSGERVTYDRLVLATGARNRRLPVQGADLAGVHQLRHLGEADALRAAVGSATRVAVVGAGFIGMELASSVVDVDRHVHVLEAAPRALGRNLSSYTAEHLVGALRAAGGDLSCDTSVTEILGEDGRATGVRLAGGEVLPVDLVVVAIGVEPNDELASQAGLETADGVVVDACLRTGDQRIWAVGDCARFPARSWNGEHARVESVQNATDHARLVAGQIVEGRAAEYAAVPWFWSKQGLLKLQIAGLSRPDDTVVLREERGRGGFSVFRFDGDRLTAVESVDRAGDHLAARRILESGLCLARDQVADPGFDLKAASRLQNASA